MSSHSLSKLIFVGLDKKEGDPLKVSTSAFVKLPDVPSTVHGWPVRDGRGECCSFF